MEDGEAVVDAAGGGEAMRFDQLVVVHPELCHDDDWCEPLVVDVCYLQLPLGCIAQQQYDGIGFAQLVFEHQVTAHLRHEQETDE